MNFLGFCWLVSQWNIIFCLHRSPPPNIYLISITKGKLKKSFSHQVIRKHVIFPNKALSIIGVLFFFFESQKAWAKIMFQTYFIVFCQIKKSWVWFIISCRYYVDAHVWHFLRNISVSEVFKKMHIWKEFRVLFFFSLCVYVWWQMVEGGVLLRFFMFNMFINLKEFTGKLWTLWKTDISWESIASNNSFL